MILGERIIVMNPYRLTKQMPNNFTLTLLFLSALYLSPSVAQVDVQKYSFEVTVNDQNNNIDVHGNIELLLISPTKYFTLDLEGVDAGNIGMTIKSLLIDGKDATFEHSDEKVRFTAEEQFSAGKHQIDFSYGGIPSDGLVIGKNKFGDRTFFGDNWPNRGHCWLLSNDHPSDKAKIDFCINAPQKYTVVSNGSFVDATKKGEVATTCYSSKYELPIKVSVIGVAELESQTLNDLDLIVTNYVYPQNKEEGFRDMKCASDCIRFFEDYIAPYPFEKLYNVQSTTRFGGMENAGCIFYDENAITGKNSMESLIAHEIAHQWFGNCATESDWQHLWLSEGFATYFTNLYIENKYGIKQFQEQMKKDRQKVIRFAKSYASPVVDTTYKDLMDLLNPNSYQKGSWVLHMLRNIIGDEAFKLSIQEYFKAYAYKNASTNDLLNVMQEYGAMDLNEFFDQWLRTGGHPILQPYLSQVEGHNELIIKQTQEKLFFFPIEIQITYGNSTETITTEINDRTTRINLKDYSGKIKYVLDPEVKILFETKGD